MDQDGLTTMSVDQYQGVINYPPGIITCQMDASGKLFPPRWVPGVCGSSHAVCNGCGTYDYEPYYSQGFQWQSNNCQECLDTYSTTGILPVYSVESGHYTFVYWVSNEVCEHCTWKKKEDEDRKKEKLLQRARECRRQRMNEPGAKDARNAYDRKVYDPEQHSSRRRKNYAAKKRSKEDCEKDFHAQRQRALEKQFGKVAVTAKAKSSVPENATSTAAKKPLSSSSKQTTPAKTQVEVKPAKNAFPGIVQKKKK